MSRKILIFFIIIALIFIWIFSGWPVIWQNPRIPPEVSEALAAGSSRQNYYAESTGESTYNTSTGYQDKTTLSFTPDDNSTYVIIASWLMKEGSVSYQVKGKLVRTTGTAKNFNELIYRPKDVTDYISGGAVAIDTFGSSPGSQTYKIQYATNNILGTAYIKEAKIIAIKLDALDKYAEVEARTQTALTGYQDKTTLTFTPDTAGDYIIIASATGDGESASYDFRTQLDIDGTAYSNYNIEPAYLTNRYLWGMVKKVNLTAESHTIKIQYSTESANSSREAGIAHARIVALRADLFNNNYYAESENRSTTTSTSYQDQTTLTQTPLAEDHLIIGSSGLDGSSGSYEAYGQLIKGSTSYGEMLIETKDALNKGYPYFVIKKETLTNSSTTWKMQYKTEKASGTAGIKDARISVIELKQPYITVGTSGTQTSNIEAPSTNTYAGGAFTFVRSSGSANITQIVINEEGTVDANSDLSNLDIYYETAGTCTYDGDETFFGTATSFNASDQATVTGTMAVGTSQVCVYVVLDVGSGASISETIEIEISNPSNDVTVSTGTVDGSSAVQISGTSTIIKPYVTIGTTGTQITNVDDFTNVYIGGAFTAVRSANSTNITQIVINEEGTVDANSDLSNLDIYYETAGTCTYDGDETFFGTATSFNASDQATVTGTMAVGTSQVCVYVVLDVGSGASISETIEIEISNPSNDVTVSTGTVSGSSAVQISGTSTILKIISVSIDDGSVEYGVLNSNDTSDTLSSQTQTVTNNGNVLEDFDIKGYNATGGGCTWTLISGTPSADQYKHEFSTNSGSNWTALGTEYNSLTTLITKGSNFSLDLKITMPNSSSCYGQQTASVTILASEAVLSGYAKRKSITVTNSSGSSLTNYQTKLTVTYDSDMQADFDDLRFTSSDGTTLIDYWLESKTDSTSAIVWVEVPSLATGANTIYMYYGNDSVASASSGSETFYIFDNLESGSIDTDIWDIKTSYGSCGIKSDNQYEGTYAVGSNQSFFEGGGEGVYDQNHFLVKLADQSGVGYRVLLNVKRWFDDYWLYWGHFGGFGFGGTTETYSIPYDNTYRLYESKILRTDNSTLSLKINANETLVYDSNVSLALGSTITYGIQTRHNGAQDNSLFIRGDFLRVSKYVATEPTYVINSEETL